MIECQLSCDVRTQLSIKPMSNLDVLCYVLNMHGENITPLLKCSNPFSKCTDIFDKSSTADNFHEKRIGLRMHAFFTKNVNRFSYLNMLILTCRIIFLLDVFSSCFDGLVLVSYLPYS